MLSENRLLLPVIGTEGRHRQPRLVIEIAYRVALPGVAYGNRVRDRVAPHHHGIAVDNGVRAHELAVRTGNLQTLRSRPRTACGYQPTTEMSEMQANGSTLDIQMGVKRSRVDHFLPVGEARLAPLRHLIEYETQGIVGLSVVWFQGNGTA